VSRPSKPEVDVKNTSTVYYTSITTQSNITIYTYHAHNLLLSYSLAILFTLISCLLGAYACYENGHSHSRSFSAILASTGAAELMERFYEELIGRLPLHDNFRRSRLGFERWGEA
jgi:hypothetical protein